MALLIDLVRLVFGAHGAIGLSMSMQMQASPGTGRAVVLRIEPCCGVSPGRRPSLTRLRRRHGARENSGQTWGGLLLRPPYHVVLAVKVCACLASWRPTAVCRTCDGCAATCFSADRAIPPGISSKEKTMNAFITDDQRTVLLANGRRALEEEGFDPVPVVTPDAGATWLLTEIDPDGPDHAFGLCDLGLGCPELG